jgi:hypothetical protein
MTLGEKQELFFRLEARLLSKALEICDREGITIRGGDAFRDARVHGIYGEKKSYASAYSLHKLKLARDLNFIKDGRLLVETKYFQELGEWWEKQHELCRWGGRFKDAGHFSLTHDGKA